MSHVLKVHVVQSKHDLVQNLGSLSLIKLPSRTSFWADDFKQIASFQILHDHVVTMLILQQLEHPCDMRMICFFEQQQLVLQQLLQHFLGLHFFLINYFYGHYDARCFMRSLNYCAETALAQLFAYLKVSFKFLNLPKTLYLLEAEHLIGNCNNFSVDLGQISLSVLKFDL